MAVQYKLTTRMNKKLTWTYILHVCTHVQNLNLLQPKLWPVVQVTKQWAKKLTYNADSYDNYTTTTLNCNQWSSAEISAELKMLFTAYFLLVVCWTARYTTRRFPAILTTLKSNVKSAASLPKMYYENPVRDVFEHWTGNQFDLTTSQWCGRLWQPR